MVGAAWCAQRLEVAAAVEVEAARIEDTVALVAGDYCGGASVESVAGTGTARVVHEAVAAWIEDEVAINVAAASVVYEGVAGVRSC